MSSNITPHPAAEAETEHSDRASGLFRTLPHNVEAEKALLGAIFANNKAYEKVSEFLLPEHFAMAENGLIFGAASRLIERGQIANPVTMTRYFEQDENLTDVGGQTYLSELAASVVSIINAGEYGRIIFDLHLKRELIGLGEDVTNRAYGGEVDDEATDQIEAAEQTLYDLATTGQYEGGFQPFKTSIIEALEMAEAAHKRDGALAGVTTGLNDLDAMLGGLHPSDLIILAGRPSMGKTALATNIAYNAAYTHHQSGGKEGSVVGFFSLEMSAEQLATRIISEQTETPSDSIRKGKITTPQFDRLVAMSQALHDIPIFIDDTPALTVSALRTRARRLKRKNNLGMIVVDYLQLISGSSSSRNDGRVQEVSEITRGLKTLAKELDVPVLALSQLSRAVEQREDKRPQLADLRDSGSIEQDADVVMFIFREEYYLERKGTSQHDNESDDKFYQRQQRNDERLDKVRNMAEVIISKQRHGPVGTVNLQFTGEFTRFGDLDQYHQQDY
ncbi:MAG: replicative DNA helicase [Rhodospirillaceae bacterium]|jgi:replicative DNA helicase|nr:replicative DNA helicase [Rhodospirillaceae bacterium]MBT4220223.1 replicative DNA helicase [Rhodospirillaceae bacterium]MBT4463329.1 replicative DNA helicase [Rhodospirillaceae bacterium]MBT5014368.1 replicative DNA helicase [Rhodospirillaceae bacterium]MBT7356083.1 replicative DNA helicase [Rhodospirillaceae bacterium]